MRKTKPVARTPKAKVVLPGSVIEALDREVVRIESQEEGLRTTRSGLASRLIKSGLLRRVMEEESKRTAYMQILQEAEEFKSIGKEAQREGDDAEARSLFLKAAAAELDALAVLGVRSEDAVKTTLMEVLMLLKSATGYKRLPEIPGRDEFVRES